MKTKLKSYIDEATDFHGKEVPKVDYLAAISLESALKNDEKYYLQVFSKKYTYIEKNMARYVTDDLENFSDDSDEE